MKSFKFQQFEIHQSKDVFRVGTDAVLLGAMVDVLPFKNVLEVGVGTGIISLMMAQRNPNAQIMGIDINEKAYELAKRNFDNSIFSNRLDLVLGDFTDYQFSSGTSFDLIVSNPPYFDENSSSKDVVARQKIKLNFEQLIVNSVKYLSDNGQLSIIIPAQFYNEVDDLAKRNHLFLVRKINIFGIEGGEIKRLVLSFSKKQAPLFEENFIIEKSPRNYSDSYLELTKEFHVFSK